MKNPARQNTKTLVLLDAHAIIHRAYHALPAFVTSSGIPTGALYGTLSFIIKVIKELNPDYIAACYDLPGGTFRHEAFGGYKAGRAEADDALISQLKRSRELVASLGIPIYDHAGFEADDMLGTIVEQLKNDKNISIMIASGDMDTLQLVDGARVRVYTLRKGIQDTVIYDEDAVVARYGFKPVQLVDYKGLRGDPSDNIPGVPGIGEKTATALITAYGSLAEIYAAIKKNSDALIERGIKKRIITLLVENEHAAFFSRELAEIRRDAPITFTLPEKPWHESIDFAIADAICDELEIRTLKARLHEVVSAEGKPPRRERAAADDASSPDDDEDNEVADEDDMGEDIRRAALMAWIVRSDNTAPSRRDILFHSGASTIADAERVFEKRIEADGLERVYRDIELPLTPVLRAAERQGVLIDREYLAGLARDYHAELEETEREIWKLAGSEFNINSPRQLGVVLFDTLGLRSRKKTAGGARSTNVAQLEALRGEHPIIEEIMRHREIQKLLSTYVDAIPNLLDDDNRLHTTFDQAGTTTGRLASRDPNLQNIPIRTERGRMIRRAFVTPPDHSFVVADYSQLELRIAAMLSGDEKLIAAFRDGGDFHTMVAAETFGIAPEAVTKDLRRKAKVINFGILYGMGVQALGKQMGVSRAEATLAYERYRERFSGLFTYFEEVKRFARENGYTTTLFGRRRYFPDIASPVSHVRAAAERMSVNAPIQGTEADIIKLAMVRIAERVEKEHLDCALVLQVHDELVYEVRDFDIASLALLVREEMEGVVASNSVTFIADVSTGRTWGTLEPYTTAI